MAMTTPLEWQNEGIEPSENLKQTGFTAGYKPAAGTFNYIFHNKQLCLKELQAAATAAELIPRGLGIPCAGNTLKPTYNISVVAGVGSEIFNDTRIRQFDSTNKASTGNVATGAYSHAEGSLTTATGTTAHAEGYRTTASGNGSHAEGYETTASGDYSHAEGFRTEASGLYSHAEGTNSIASGRGAHTEGYATKAVGDYSHAEGNFSEARGKAAHSENMAIAFGDYSSAGGDGCLANGICSFAHGTGTVANDYQAVFGTYNDPTIATSASLNGTEGSVFVVGIGTESVSGSNITINKRNGFRVSKEGRCYGAGSFAASGADYAEFFEWQDGNPNDEDRRGLFVTLDGKKIRIANADDEYILGIISANPSIVANCYADEWQGMYLKDVFGSQITKTIETEDGTETRFVVNPEYDYTLPYVSREYRPEWDEVGTHGQLVVIDDGTCVVDGYCQVADGGTATTAAGKTPYKVVERLDSEHIRVFI